MWRDIKFIFLVIIIFSCEDRPVAVNYQQNFEGHISAAQSKLIYTEAKGFFNGTQLSIAIIKEGKPNFYGIEIKNDTMFSVENFKRVFEIGSISKVFTATMLADLSLEGKLALDDPVNKYLPWKLRDDQAFTLQQLSNHTSGLPRLPDNLLLSEVNMENPYKDYGEEKLAHYLTQQLDLQQNPGEKFDYSNLGVGLLGFILTQVDKSSYEDLLLRKINGPFQLAATTTQREKIEDQLVNGLNTEGEETSNWDLNVLVGAGGILSTAEDLAKFALAQFDHDNKALSLTRKQTFSITDYEKAIGLGWMIQNRAEGKRLTHSGGTGGYTSFLMIDEARENGVVILSNVSAFSPEVKNISNLGGRLMEMIENEE